LQRNLASRHRPANTGNGPRHDHWTEAPPIFANSPTMSLALIVAALALGLAGFTLRRKEAAAARVDGRRRVPPGGRAYDDEAAKVCPMRAIKMHRPGARMYLPQTAGDDPGERPDAVLPAGRRRRAY